MAGAVRTRDSKLGWAPTACGEVSSPASLDPSPGRGPASRGLRASRLGRPSRPCSAGALRTMAMSSRRLGELVDLRPAPDVPASDLAFPRPTFIRRAGFCRTPSREGHRLGGGSPHDRAKHPSSRAAFLSRKQRRGKLLVQGGLPRCRGSLDQRLVKSYGGRAAPRVTRGNLALEGRPRSCPSSAIRNTQLRGLPRLLHRRGNAALAPGPRNGHDEVH